MDYEAEYRRLHESYKKFSGYSIIDCLPELIDAFRSRPPTRILDYGCGKGFQYLAKRVHEQWGGPLPHCFDPGVVQLSQRPTGKFDGIICTDVMEHIEENDVDRILADLFSFADDQAVVFFNIACRPARSKKLSDGRNVHVTVKPPQWWDEKLSRFRVHGLDLHVIYDEKAA